MTKLRFSAALCAVLATGLFAVQSASAQTVRPLSVLMVPVHPLSPGEVVPSQCLPRAFASDPISHRPYPPAMSQSGLVVPARHPWLVCQTSVATPNSMVVTLYPRRIHPLGTPTPAQCILQPFNYSSWGFGGKEIWEICQ